MFGNRRLVIAGALTLAIVVVGSILPQAGSDARAEEKSLPVMQVWKTPTCGCCGKWIDHMRAAGFHVQARDIEDMTVVKQLAGVPDDKASCHTAIIDGYVIEGHVPARDVRRLLKERPAVVGLSVPGMVSGSPGMENGRVEPYDVVTFGKGESKVFSSYR